MPVGVNNTADGWGGGSQLRQVTPSMFAEKSSVRRLRGRSAEDVIEISVTIATAYGATTTNTQIIIMAL